MGNGNSLPTKRKRDPKGTRERLIKAAIELFTTVGFHASTTPLIAERAGIAEGTIYRHFDSKEHLLNEIFRAAVRLLAAQIQEAGKLREFPDRLHAISATWVEIARANPPLIRLVFLTDLGGLLDSNSEAARESILNELEKLMVEGKAAGHVRAGSARIWADVWLRLVILVLERSASGDWPPDHPAPQQVLSSAWSAIASATR